MSYNRKSAISFKRKMTIYYRRFVIFMQLLMLVSLLFFTLHNRFQPQRENILNYFLSLSQDHALVLENIVIDGQKNASYNDIINALNADKGDAILQINLTQCKEALESNIWIEHAIIERRLPNTISIGLVEHVPIAIWQFQQKLYLIDREGNRITNYHSGFDHLLHIVGQDANLYAEQLLVELNRYPKLRSSINSAVRYGQRRWNLNLEKSITVKMPEDNFEYAYEYLNSMYKKNILFEKNYKMIDLRDSKKYYLEYK